MSESSAGARPPIILVASDEEWSARSFETILSAQGYAVLRTTSGKQTLDLARATQPSALVLELRLTDIDGIDVCRRIRESAVLPASTPIVLTAAGAIGYHERLEAYRAGVWEVCTQPFDSTLLMLRLENFLAARREVEQLVEESLIDQPTGLYNARGLTKRAREIGADAQRHHTPLACVAFSLESEEGDASPELLADMLAHASEQLSQLFRRMNRVSDAIGRLGQSEFAIVAPTTEEAGAARLAARVVDSLTCEPAAVMGKEYRVKVRAGYAAVSDFAEASVDVIELLMRASAALRYGRARRSNEAVLAFQHLPAGTLPS